MKTRFLIILLVLSILFPTSNIFAPPSPNEWSSAPYCPDGDWNTILSRLESGTDTDNDAAYISANLSDC
jgi:hypothetical protein